MHMSNIDPSEFRKITQRLQQPLWICFMQKVPSQGPATSTANSTNSIKGMELAIIYPAPVQVQSVSLDQPMRTNSLFQSPNTFTTMAKTIHRYDKGIYWWPWHPTICRENPSKYMCIRLGGRRQAPDNSTRRSHYFVARGNRCRVWTSCSSIRFLANPLPTTANRRKPKEPW